MIPCSIDCHATPQRRAADQLHRDVVHRFAADRRLADVVNRDEVRMTEHRRATCFVLESQQRIAIVRERLGKNLDRDPRPRRTSRAR